MEVGSDPIWVSFLLNAVVPCSVVTDDSHVLESESAQNDRILSEVCQGVC